MNSLVRLPLSLPCKGALTAIRGKEARRKKKKKSADTRAAARSETGMQRLE